MKEAPFTGSLSLCTVTVTVNATVTGIRIGTVTGQKEVVTGSVLSCLRVDLAGNLRVNLAGSAGKSRLQRWRSRLQRSKAAPPVSPVYIWTIRPIRSRSCGSCLRRAGRSSRIEEKSKKSMSFREVSILESKNLSKDLTKSRSVEKSFEKNR